MSVIVFLLVVIQDRSIACFLKFSSEANSSEASCVAASTTRGARLAPARRAEAPAVAGFQSRKTEIRHRRRQVVAACLAELEEFGGHHRADGMHADVLGRGVAAAVAEKSGQRPLAAGLQLLAQHVAGMFMGIKSSHVRFFAPCSSLEAL
jgi:hypothetical protein